jgi:hypothetical protein
MPLSRVGVAGGAWGPSCALCPPLQRARLTLTAGGRGIQPGSEVLSLDGGSWEDQPG